MKKKNEEVSSSEVQYSTSNGWKFYVNDTLVTEQEYIDIMDAHMRWVQEQEQALAKSVQESEKESTKKPKKPRIPKK